MPVKLADKFWTSIFGTVQKFQTIVCGIVKLLSVSMKITAIPVAIGINTCGLSQKRLKTSTGEKTKCLYFLSLAGYCTGRTGKNTRKSGRDTLNAGDDEMTKTATCLFTGEQVSVSSMFAMRKPESYLIKYKSGAVRWAHFTEIKF